ncbi:hypothetical protein C6341_g16142 [Phytophthora cactorum]|nr:hypothetical protein C6341_g16142 [Phytophthora cactorum]
MIERYKARLVACGHEQKFGINFFIVYGDVPNAYVKATTEEGVEILLFVPEGLVSTEEEITAQGAESVDEVGLLLGQSLYGLKQVGRLWHEHLHHVLVMIGFIQFVTNVCLYLAADSGGMTVVGTYVDDLLVTGTDKGSVSPFFVEMGGLELKGLSVTSHFLGMSVQYDGQSGYKFGQEAAIVEMLTKFGLAKANSVRAPIGGEDPAETDVADLLPHATKEMTPTELTVASFQSLVGSLLWIARCTRSDMFAVHCATRRAHAPTMTDSLEACYANRQIPEWHPISQVGHDNRKSVSAAVVQLNGMTVSWQCKKQSSVVLWTTETEYVAATVGGQGLLGQKELLSELSTAIQLPKDMLMDNQVAIVQGVVVPKYVASEDMLADLLTKALPSPRMKELREKIGLDGIE